MGQNIKLWQLLSGVITVLLGVGGLVWSQATTIAELKSDNKYLKQDNLVIHTLINDVNNKLDIMQIRQDAKSDKQMDKINELLVLMQNKQDRK